MKTKTVIEAESGKDVLLKHYQDLCQLTDKNLKDFKKDLELKIWNLKELLSQAEQTKNNLTWSLLTGELKAYNNVLDLLKEKKL